ncbi:MAG: hypothetical protein M3364_05020 [Actinomycetota bacterium]|nr:hypothetical protein [Actinomycetota bacterium]
MSAVHRLVLAAGALVCVACAVLIGLLAIDVARWNDAFATGDVRYRAVSADERLWQLDELAPFDAGRRSLGVQDDIDFREAVRALREAELDDPVISDPEVAVRRNEAQARLEAIVARDTDDTRRSRAAGLLGVLGLARFVYETQDREALLSATIANLTRAIALDPENDEAKYNLELGYQRGRGLELTEASAGSNAAPGGQGSKGAGAGQPGSGY